MENACPKCMHFDGFESYPSKCMYAIPRALGFKGLIGSNGFRVLEPQSKSINYLFDQQIVHGIVT